MNKKIWIIEDTSEKKSSAKGGIQGTASSSQQKSYGEKDPSLAFSLSILLWGCGQFYNRQWRLGTIFLICMILFYTSIIITVAYWESIKSTYESMYVDCSETLLLFSLFYLSGIFIWLYNAWQAYLRSMKLDLRHPKGIKRTVIPVVCSLFMPGWGQLLNGQIKKGFFFQIFSLAGITAVSFILITVLVWPELEASRARSVIEWIFSVSVLISPCILLMWMLNIFDAIRVSKDNTKKDPLKKRIRYAINKYRHHIQVYGWKNTLFSLVKKNILVMVLLVFCVISYYYVPGNFYVQQLHYLGGRMTERDMAVIPALIKKLPDY